jgi:hypothetical protein
MMIVIVSPKDSLSTILLMYLTKRLKCQLNHQKCNLFLGKVDSIINVSDFVSFYSNKGGTFRFFNFFPQKNENLHYKWPSHQLKKYLKLEWKIHFHLSLMEAVIFCFFSVFGLCHACFKLVKQALYRLSNTYSPLKFHIQNIYLFM